LSLAEPTVLPVEISFWVLASDFLGFKYQVQRLI
jgi:hypothetical protein